MERIPSPGAMGIRTPDLLNAIEALYQLSYDPLEKKFLRGIILNNNTTVQNKNDL